MSKADYLLNKIDKHIEEISEMDFHFIPGIMVTCAWQGRFMRLRESKEVIDSYFIYSPEVFKIVRNYKVERLMKFLERTACNWPKISEEKINK